MYQRGDRQTSCLPGGVILVNPKAMEIFLIKSNLKPKLLQFMDILTSMDLVWKKLGRGYDPWEQARWHLSFPKPSVQGHDPCRNPGQGLELLSILGLLPRQRYRAPFCCHSSREVPVVLNRNFTADPRNWVMALLFLYKNCIAAYCLLTSHLCPSQPLRPGPQQVLSIYKLVMLHQLRVVFFL